MAKAAQRNQEQLAIYYAGPEGNIKQTLQLSPEFILVPDVESATVIIINNTMPDIQAIQNQVKAGAGLVVFLGPEISSEMLSELVGDTVIIEQTSIPESLNDNNLENTPFWNIIWNSAPQVRERGVLRGASSIVPLVQGYSDQSIILGMVTTDDKKGYIFTPYLNETNPQFQDWAYFNYFIYCLVMGAADLTPENFAAYPASPVPHSNERTILYTILAGILVTAGVVFYLIRKYSLAHPEYLERLINDRRQYETHQMISDWESVGFHRALGGFMLSLMLGLILFIPTIVYQNLVLPAYILPSAQALGIWGRVTQFFNFLWLFLDMGTSAAFIKFFAQYRVNEPQKAIQFGQIFVWWQALSGAVQVALITALASSVVPKTIYALYAWSIILHVMIQIPGFYQVMRHALMAWQRFDYAQILEIGLYLIFPILSQPLIVSLMVFWGRNNPVFGGAMGGLLGLGLAAYVSEVMAFLLGYLLYHRLGFNARVLFLAHFDWKIIQEAFRFGVFEMLGSVAWAIGQAVEIIITQTRLINYTEIWGNWVLAQNFIFSFNVMQNLYNNLMPSISEAISTARNTLSQYYTAMAYKWGGLISAFICSVLLAVADRFIIGASGPEFMRSAVLAAPLIIWGAIQYPSWVGDIVQLGSNRPYLKAIMVAGEQMIRIILAYLLLERFQIYALIIAYFVGLLTKDIVAYLVNHRICFPQRFYIWQSMGAPILSGVAHYLAVRFITGLIWQGDQVTSVLIFLIGILFSYPLYMFFTGLFGGWDDGTLIDLRHAVRLSSFMRPMARILLAAIEIGARISPLHGRFPVEIRAQALQEAALLTMERVSI
jgi:O-antigen/teichoic acid export membrane protein